MKTNRLHSSLRSATACWLAWFTLLNLTSAAADAPEVSGLTNGARIRWNALPADQLPGRVQNAGGGEPGDWLRVENPEGLENRFHLVRLQTPQVTGKSYALRVPVRYEGVQGMAYLELWNFFAAPAGGTNEEAYFSRTLAGVGPLAALNGSSDGWTERVLPFFAEGRKPVRVEFNLVMPGKGRVEIGPAEWIGDAAAIGQRMGAIPSSGVRWAVVGIALGLGILGAWLGLRRWRTIVETRRMLAADQR